MSINGRHRLVTLHQQRQHAGIAHCFINSDVRVATSSFSRWPRARATEFTSAKRRSSTVRCDLVIPIAMLDSSYCRINRALICCSLQLSLLQPFLSALADSISHIQHHEAKETNLLLHSITATLMFASRRLTRRATRLTRLEVTALGSALHLRRRCVGAFALHAAARHALC